MRKHHLQARILTYICSYFMVLALTACSSTPIFQGSLFGSPTVSRVPVSNNFATDPAFWQGDPRQIWARLQSISSARLAAAQSQTGDSIAQGWIRLALISKRYSTDTNMLVREVLAWRQVYPSHQANALIPDNNTLDQLQSAPTSQHVAVLLPLQGQLASFSQMARDGILSGYYQTPAARRSQSVKFYDTAQSGNIAMAYQDALSKGADFVIGPLTKDSVQSLINSGNISVTTLALNYTNGSLPTNLYEFGLLPEDEAKQIAERAWQSGRSRAIIIAPQNAWGQRMIKALRSQWSAMGGSVKDIYYYNSQSNFNADIAQLLHIDIKQDRELMKKENNRTLLERQRRQDFDVIFMFAQPREARIIVPLLRYYYAGNIPVFATSASYGGKPNQASDEDLNGVTICNSPWILQHARGTAISDSGEQWDNLYALGRDAYLLSRELDRLKAMPYFPIYGATGALTLDRQAIHRRLPCVTIRHGRLS